MSPGDKLVQGVGGDWVVPDIKFNVPCGIPTVIPGNKACDSTDLYRMISSGQIRDLGMQLDTHPRLNNRVLHQSKPLPLDSPVQEPIEDPEVIELRSQLNRLQADLRLANAENQRLSASLNGSRTECGQLLAECSKLRSELAKLQEGDSKLNAILGKLDNLPTQMVVQAGSFKEGTQTRDVEGERDIPIFMPTMPTVKSSKVTVKTNVVANLGETAGDALRRFRKSKSS
jgi:hypothetical protein